MFSQNYLLGRFKIRNSFLLLLITDFFSFSALKNNSLYSIPSCVCLDYNYSHGRTTDISSFKISLKGYRAPVWLEELIW